MEVLGRWDDRKIVGRREVGVTVRVRSGGEVDMVGMGRDSHGDGWKWIVWGELSVDGGGR